jgi:hypothetical protein
MRAQADPYQAPVVAKLRNRDLQRGRIGSTAEHQNGERSADDAHPQSFLGGEFSPRLDHQGEMRFHRQIVFAINLRTTWSKLSLQHPSRFSAGRAIAADSAD